MLVYSMGSLDSFNKKTRRDKNVSENAEMRVKKQRFSEVCYNLEREWNPSNANEIEWQEFWLTNEVNLRYPDTL